MMRYRPGVLARRIGAGVITPSFVAAGTAGHASGSVTYSYPAGIAADDILLLLLENGGADGAPSSGAGWVHVTNSPSADTTGTTAQQTRISVLWKRYDGTGSSIAVGDLGDHQNGIVVAFRNCALTGNPWDVTAAG